MALPIQYGSIGSIGQDALTLSALQIGEGVSRSNQTGYGSKSPLGGHLRLIAYALLLIVGTGCRVSGRGPGSDDARRALLLDPDDPIWSEAAPDSFDVALTTSKGDVRLRVWRRWAPRGVDRFFQLVRQGFYDDSRFYRVRAGFIAQFGIPGDPAISAVWADRTIPDDSVRSSNTRGTFAYAMTGPDTRTTQIYFNYADNSRLDAQGFAPLGRVLEGMDRLDSLYAEYDERAGGGMRGGQQGPLFEGGNAYLDREFPNLDRLIRTRIVMP